MPTLSKDLRRTLENVVADARRIAEAGAEQALKQLAVDHSESWPAMTTEEKALREKLRAHGKQLGDKREANRTQEIPRLKQACAYEHWHRMLFARFLAENNLLIHPEYGEPISLEEVRELARELNVDWLSIAASFAQKMLLEVFRPDDPVLDLILPPETRQKLEEKLAALPNGIFTAEDSLGWVYQFWQSDEKDAVNESAQKIGPDEIAAVTQLFTEDYMVLFLLENTLGAWWTARHGRPDLNGYTWTYLRVEPDGTPSVGGFTDWPDSASKLRILDPSMGSGHFLTFALPLLARMRADEERLSLRDAVSLVLRDNLYGLEIDQRCSQIAAFNLALTAWRLTGEHFSLPPMNIACSGLGINASSESWVALAGNNLLLKDTLAELYSIFQRAPLLGSLIDPTRLGQPLLFAKFDEVWPLLQEALGAEQLSDDSRELAIAAKGVLATARILSSQFTLVATNVPYLGRHKHNEVLNSYCEQVHYDARADLATCFVDRSLRLCTAGGMIAFVTPHSWLYQDRYKDFRLRLLRNSQWCFAARLGAHAFSTISGEVVNVSLVAIKPKRAAEVRAVLLDVSSFGDPDQKAGALRQEDTKPFQQDLQLTNPDGRIVFGERDEDAVSMPLLATRTECYQGLRTGDANRFIRCFWEPPAGDPGWEFFQTSADEELDGIAGLSYSILWQGGQGELAQYAAETREKLHDMHESGNRSWGKAGVAVGQMTLRASRYFGQKFDNSLAVITPSSPSDLPALFAFCRSSQYSEKVREISPGMYITNQSLVKVPFDVSYWQGVADDLYAKGLPRAFTADPAQWLFSGGPVGAKYPLQVAVARLLGYRWPRQQGVSFPQCDDVPADGLEKHEDDGGIICLSSLGGEETAADRLRKLLEDAYGSEWSANRLAELLGGSQSLETWLRDKFFEEHCAVFHDRPFVWHVWDGRKDGFHALVNYHRLAASDGQGKKTLEKLIYTVLGDWISRQRAELASGVDGADSRLTASLNLQSELEHILVGEQPYDIFVRWKPFHKQPIGWEPDLNDGVRFNMRPWLTTALPAHLKPKKGACILRVTPRIPFGKDRGKDPARDKADFPWFAESTDRNNDIHLSIEQKRAARERSKK